MGRSLFQLKSGRLACVLAVCLISACKSVQVIEQVPNDNYRISRTQYQKLGSETLALRERSLLADVAQSDSVLTITPENPQLKVIKLKLNEIDQLKMYRTLSISMS